MVIFKKGAIIGFLAMLTLVLSSNAYSSVLINEILANGLNDPDSEWIEIFNNESSAVNLTNWNISESFSSNFTLNAILNAIIPANSFIILAGDFKTFNSAYPNVNLSGIRIINITLSNFQLSDLSGEVNLYNSSGALVDSIYYVQASGKAFENVSIGRYPDGSSAMFNLSTLTPGAKNELNSSPRIDSFSPSALTITIAENSALKFSINASDPDDTLLNFFWFIDNTLNSTNPANFSYTPGFSDSGTHIINATIKDADSNQASVKWTVIVTNVNRAPILEVISNKIASKNINLSFNITASDLDNDNLIFSSNHSAIAVSKINNSIAEVSWKPTNKDLGNNTINLTVSDGSLTDSKVIVITVNVTSNSAPAIISTPKTTAVINERYTYDATAVDSDNDALSFSLKTNASGMSIDSSTGAITFVPSSVGFFIVDISVTDFIEITNQSFNLTVKQGSRLKISDVDVKIDGKKSSNVANNTKISKEAEPGSRMEFKVKVRNDFLRNEDLKIENIDVKAIIEEIDDGDDLEEESKEFELRAEDYKTITFKFELPLNVDEDTFDVLISAEGEDENGTAHKQHFEIGLEVEKKKHDLRFFSFDLSPSMINCNRIVGIDYKIINVGQEDEENAVLEIKNDGLKLNFLQNFSIDSGTDDNTFSKSLKFKLNDNAEDGIYPIIANTYSDGKLLDTKIKEIKVEDCITIGEAKEEEAVLITPIPKQSKTIKAIKEEIEAPIIRISFKEANENIQLLVLSTLIFTAFFVFTAIILFARF